MNQQVLVLNMHICNIKLPLDLKMKIQCKYILKSCHRRNRREHNSFNHYDTPSLIEVDPPPPPIVRVDGSFEIGSLPSSTHFSQGIMEGPYPKKVKMPFIGPFDEIRQTTYSDDHLYVYEVHMYVQDIDGAMC